MLVLNWARFSRWSKCLVFFSNKIWIFSMEIFWHYSKIASWFSSIPFKTPLDLNEGVLRFKGVNFWRWGDYSWFKSSAVCQCVLYKILSWACYLDFCSVVSKNVQKWDTLVESFIIKGQLISKCPFGVFKSPKQPTKFFPGFLP